jgi:uncharacterized membrane protein
MSRTTVYLTFAGLVLWIGVAAGGPPTFSYSQIDFPGAKSTSGSGLNARGDIVGSYTDQANKTHGFLLSGGDFTTIDYPGAVATRATGINSQGDIVGTHNGPNLLTPGSGGDIHGFLLRAGASLPDPVDYPGHMNTITQRITETGQILGCYHDHDTMGSMHGILVSDGNFIALDGKEYGRTEPASMNNGESRSGRVITGLYSDMMGTHSYVISDGNFASFDFPRAIATSAWDMNPSGEIVGVYVDSAAKTHGFLLRHGEFVSIDYPAPGVKASRVFGINPEGDVVGAYVDATGATHGFLLTRTGSHAE